MAPPRIDHFNMYELNYLSILPKKVLRNVPLPIISVKKVVEPTKALYYNLFAP